MFSEPLLAHRAEIGGVHAIWHAPPVDDDDRDQHDDRADDELHQVLAEIKLDTPESLELPEPLQRGAFQPLGITRDGTLPVPFSAGHAAIECGNELAQIVNEGLV